MNTNEHIEQASPAISRLGKNDLTKFIELIRVFEDVFEMQNFLLPDSGHLQRLLNKEDFFVFIAQMKSRVVGGLTAYTLEQYYSEKPLAYLFDLAVDKQHQRKGIGRRLVTALRECCYQQGYEEVFVQADQVDDYAIDFYRSTKPTNEENVVHFSYSLEGGFPASSDSV